jgi:hypothetical protein
MDYLLSGPKLVPSFLVGERNTADAITLMTDVAARLANRVQLTTDGHRPYFGARRLDR